MKVEQHRRDKDPILFGTFQDKYGSRTVIDRFYYLGDWIDEYCDLTLDKMVGEMKQKNRVGITHSIKTPADIEELRLQLKSLEASRDNTFTMKGSLRKPSFWGKVKTFFTKG